MEKDRELDLIKLILFMACILLIVEMSYIVPNLFTGEMRGLIGTGIFFATFILMFFLVERFAVWDGTTLEKLGIQYDNQTIRRLIIGAVAGFAATALIAGIAFFFGGQLRPFDQITADLIMSEIIITAPTAFFEELTHRGYILPKIEKLSGKTSAILISSLFFSCMHFSWWTYPGIPLTALLLFIFNIFLGGVVLSLSYYWSNRNLWVPIAFHFVWNMVGYLMFPMYPREPVVSPEIFHFEWGITTVVGFLFGLSLIFGLLINKKNNRAGQ